jgi:hypothetical protein
MQAWSFLPPLFFDGVQLPYSDTFKYLGMMCDRQMNLNIVADAALRPFMAGTFRVNMVSHPPYMLPRYMLLDIPRDVIRSVARLTSCSHPSL